ncbi:recombinase family protein [Clostridium sp.]
MSTIIKTSERRLYGYARISSISQNISRQIKALMEYGILERDIRIDIKSGKNLDREEYQKLKVDIRTGDMVVFCELDRLGRNMSDIKNEYYWFAERHIDVTILDMPILNTEHININDSGEDVDVKGVAGIVLALMAYLAEKERVKLKNRQEAGIKIAKGLGKYKGGKRKEIPQFDELYSEWKSGNISATKAFKTMGVSAQTFYRRVKEKDVEENINNEN